MALTNCDRADVAVLIGNQEFRIYRIYRNAQLESLVLEQAKRFWDICVIGGEPPNTKSTQDANIIHPFSKKGAKVVASPEIAEVVDRIKICQREIKKLDLEMESLKAQVMSTMAEGEELTLEDKVIATWKSTKPAKRLDAQSLKLAHPDIAQAFTVIGVESRRFVIKDTE
jgi:predicted phage-related endonuclease